MSGTPASTTPQTRDSTRSAWVLSTLLLALALPPWTPAQGTPAAGAATVPAWPPRRW
jgi:hypothetical protein